MTNVDFEIITETEVIPAKALLENPYNLTRGETAQATFRFKAAGAESLTVASGTTHTIQSGEAEAYTDVTIESNATLTIETNARLTTGTLNIQENGQLNQEEDSQLKEGIIVSGWQALQSYEEHTGSYSVNTTLQNSQKFRQNLPPELTSLVVGIRPKPALQDRDVQGIWGLFASITDERNAALNEVQIQIGVNVLSDLPQYSDTTALTNDLEITI